MASQTISVIIPCWNDGELLKPMLQRLHGYSLIHELIVADASEDDQCRRLARDAGAVVVHCPQPNRGRQLNRGAAAASGSVLLFQHADTHLDERHLQSIAAATSDPAVRGGAFYREFDPSHRARQWMRPWVRLYNRKFGALYGDQSIFCRRDHFQALGGFEEIALMEDVEFSLRLRRAGGVVLLDPPILSSPRRHRRYGATRVTLENLAMLTMFRLGVSPERLHAWYYRRRCDRNIALPHSRAGCDRGVERVRKWLQ